MAWSLVGVGAVAETTGATLTLTEPAGCAAGDLLVACIAGRGYTAGTGWVTTPANWTRGWSISQANTSGTASAALANGAMFFIVRGASAPALAFTLVGTANVALGRIVAYRGNAATTPQDFTAGAFNTTATNTTAVATSSAEIITTQSNDLFVAMCAGGQEASWSNFNNSTTPIGASGATNTTTAPSTTAWIERADSLTTSGADTSLAIFDAVRTGIGAIGDISATASLAAGHVIGVLGFKIAAAAPSEFTGTGSATVNASAAASGTHASPVTGTAAATIALTATASGTHASPVTGTAAATLAASSSASGVHGVSGAAAATIALSGAANGVQGISGTAVATLALSAAASGVFYGAVTGTAAATLALSAAAAGEFVALGEVTGTGTATLALSAAAIGEFGDVDAAGLIGVWTGSAWVDKPMMVWTGSAWVQKPVMSWNGSAWV